MTLRAGIAGLAALAAAAAARADDLPPVEAIAAARDRVLARPEFRYGAAEEEPSLFERLLRWWQETVTAFQKAYPVLFLVLVAMLALALVAIVAHLLWTWGAARRARYAEDDPRDLEAALRRLDPAPFRGRALEHAAAGRLEEAVRELYTALLLTLDRRGSLRYAGHKAFLDYRIESSGDPPARAALDAFADAYPPGSFGRRPPDPARFDGLVATLDALGGAPR